MLTLRPFARSQGWLKTVDEYYYGANNSIQHANVNSIISATVLALLENPDRKFIEVEQAFFSRWWSEQTPAKQAAVKTLVANGQREMINGGWYATIPPRFAIFVPADANSPIFSHHFQVGRCTMRPAPRLRMRPAPPLRDYRPCRS